MFVCSLVRLAANIQSFNINILLDTAGPDLIVSVLSTGRDSVSQVVEHRPTAHRFSHCWGLSRQGTPTRSSTGSVWWYSGETARMAPTAVARHAGREYVETTVFKRWPA
jgi:hypothetical protein